MSIKVVQFTHPGGQYALSRIEKKKGIKEWNLGRHLRKFLIAEGQCVVGKTLSVPQKLLFWGEWEPNSQIDATYTTSTPAVYPMHLHSPFLCIGKRGNVIKHNSKVSMFPSVSCIGNQSSNCSKVCNKFQNTDPFVFGEHFYFSLCKQVRFTSLKSLDAGSIILFGSTISNKYGGPYFALDTVFVVGEKKTYAMNNYEKDLAGFIPKYYDEIMGFKAMASNVQFTCYRGATFNDPVNRMYSFVPCKIHVGEAANNAFSRVKLTDRDLSSIPIPVLQSRKKNSKYISNFLNASPNYTDSDLPTNKLVWDKICQIIGSQGYSQGMNFKYRIK